MLEKQQNRNEALHLIEKVQPDILITVIVMPGMDGIELVGMVKNSIRVLRLLYLAAQRISNMPDRLFKMALLIIY